jgi:hypothetical protein
LRTPLSFFEADPLRNQFADATSVVTAQRRVTGLLIGYAKSAS